MELFHRMQYNFCLGICSAEKNFRYLFNMNIFAIGINPFNKLYLHKNYIV